MLVALRTVFHVTVKPLHVMYSKNCPAEISMTLQIHLIQNPSGHNLIQEGQKNLARILFSNAALDLCV